MSWIEVETGQFDPIKEGPPLKPTSLEHMSRPKCLTLAHQTPFKTGIFKRVGLRKIIELYHFMRADELEPVTQLNHLLEGRADDPRPLKFEFMAPKI